MDSSTSRCFWIFAVALDVYRALKDKHPGDVKGTPTPRPKGGRPGTPPPKPAAGVLVGIDAKNPDLQADCDIVFLASPVFSGDLVSAKAEAESYVRSEPGVSFFNASLNCVLYSLVDG